VLRELFGRSGVATDAIADGAVNATMFSPSRPFSEGEWSRLNEWLDAVYADFTDKVASGRRLPPERVHELARGRVWSGADAVANGLADSAGGMRDAVAVARKRAGLPDDSPVRIFPRLGPLHQLRPAESSEALPAASGRFGAGPFGAGPFGAGPFGAGSFGAVGSAAPALAALAAQFAEGWGPAWQLAAAAGLPPSGPLMLPGGWRIS
jgi:protease IV